MNPPNDKEQAVLLRALEALHRTTGIAGRVIEREPIMAQGFRADARVEVEANGQRYPYLAEIKRVDRFAILGDIKRQCARYGDQLLLVAPRVTTEAAEKCRELDLQFIDTLGNAYPPPLAERSIVMVTVGPIGRVKPTKPLGTERDAPRPVNSSVTEHWRPSWRGSSRGSGHRSRSLDG